MSWLVLLKSKLARWALGAAAIALTVMSAIGLIRRNERERFRRDQQEQDYENADSIRRNVERDRDERMRDYEDRGFRD